ncbi:HEPN domain-containing protein [Phenylobacterium deserti]|uniref:Nucleotidyltransferase n=1 Tax=Phenylobacterium deserti TaxID=1914756 RepID=A0A328A9P9_9CAUL|nr:HEPN domain-containing protein [Phenylobacterium deserti]RAK51311.1 nucleotidyltransferase [Phenylobacterium deserti]
MKTSLDHLPEAKRRELSRIVEILFAEFEDALAGKTAPHRKAGRILKVVLYGSYARGDWVQDPIGGYTSDYDLLVVVNHEELADLAEYWGPADDHLLRAYQISRELTAPAHFIVHALSDVNRQLKRGRPFFTDIVKDGVALYEAPDHPFDQPQPLSPEEARHEAQGYFDQWFESAERYFANARENAARSWNNESAFLLHQATERLYHCLLLVLTLYSPKSHKLNFLRSQAERVAPQLIEAWPRDSRFAQRSWELLRRAYVDARYSPHYRITPEELAWLIERVGVLADQIERLCRGHVRSLTAPPDEVAQSS